MHVFIFRRDFRIVDNVEWNALRDSALNALKDIPILPIFIFNPAQIEPKRNPYHSNNAVEFMCESLLELQKESLPSLRFFYGPKLSAIQNSAGEADVRVLAAIHKETPITSLAFNSDFTPFARARDARIAEWCQQHNIDVSTSTQDYSLVDPAKMEKPYQVFTPFHNKYGATGMSPVSAAFPPPPAPPKKHFKYEIPASKLKTFFTPNPNLAVKPGRKAALDILARIKRGQFKDYQATRDFPANDASTKLSAYIKYGCVSVREVRQACLQGKTPALLRQLYWRAFYDQVTWHFPHVLEGQVSKSVSSKNKAFKLKYNTIPLDQIKDSPSWWEAFNTAKTGFPIVDAAIKQLYETGWMHNRCRMIVGSFFVKDMHMDWRIFERWMATHLVDYDPSSNSGGVQWCASTGCDSQPYFRVFNPTAQAAKWDPKGEYVARWTGQQAASASPTPMMLDHAKQSAKIKKLFSAYVK